MLGPWLSAKLGWIAAFVYCACAALRLARFNTTLDVIDKRFFQGLPSPAAACLIAGLVWAMNEYQVKGTDVRWLAWGVTMFAGLSMVSSLKFYSGKDINLRKSVPFSVVVGLAMAIIVVIAFSSTLPEMLFLLFTGYAISGYVLWSLEKLKKRRPPAMPPPSGPA
jgi:CDP-diacylglycerol--serine O-phosphatidyltransferase